MTIRFSGARRLVACAVVACAVLGAMQQASAQGYQQTRVGVVGGYEILSIYEKGRFDRCAASINGPSGMLRFAWNTARKYTISIPGAPPTTRGPFAISIDGAPPRAFNGVGNADRAWTELPNDMVDRLFNARRMLVVHWGGILHNWPINGNSLVTVFSAVEDCLKKATERLSAAPPPPINSVPAGGVMLYTAASPSFCADVHKGQYRPGTPVILYTCHGRANQRFRLDPGSGRVYAAANANLCVDAIPGGLALVDCRQLGRTWVLNRGAKEIRSSDGQCWDVPSGRFQNGARLQPWPCHRKAPQQFSDKL